jgi:hypothetical protein
MASGATPSETLAWWARAVQARRVAGMLSPRDAQLAEAFAAECENQARERLHQSVRSSVRRTVERAVGPIPGISPKEVIFLKSKSRAK